MKALPYYKFYWQAWRASRTVQRMTYIERGLYRELLDECWAEGSIPNDLTSLADICGCPEDVLANAWQMLSKCFVEIDGNRLINTRMNEERTEKDQIRVKMALSGQKGGMAKLRSKDDAEANAKQMLSKCHIEEESKVEESRVEKSKDDIKKPRKKNEIPPIPTELVPDLERLCAEWPKSFVGKDNQKVRYRNFTKAEDLWLHFCTAWSGYDPKEMLECGFKHLRGDEEPADEWSFTSQKPKAKFVKAMKNFYGVKEQTWKEYR